MEPREGQALSLMLSFQPATIPTSTFQENQQRLEGGIWLSLTASEERKEKWC